MNDCFTENLNMSEYSSMKTGGTAPRCYFPETEHQLVSVIDCFEERHEKYYVFGNLSNVLLPDGILQFTPILTVKMKGIEIQENTDGNEVTVKALCGVQLTRLAYDMCKAGYSGLEFAYGIPGTVGGAVFMNAGAYGSEMKNVVKSVDFYDTEKKEILKITADKCGFSYRNSAFQNLKGIILSAEISLVRDNPEKCLETAKDYMSRRVSKQPLEYPSCGSAFKRPEGYFAGELIEKCGLKGYSVGGASVSEKHAGFIINKGGATSADVIELIKRVKVQVKEKFGVELEPEIQVMAVN